MIPTVVNKYGKKMLLFVSEPMRRKMLPPNPASWKEAKTQSKNSSSGHRLLNGPSWRRTSNWDQNVPIKSRSRVSDFQEVNRTLEPFYPTLKRNFHRDKNFPMNFESHAADSKLNSQSVRETFWNGAYSDGDKCDWGVNLDQTCIFRRDLLKANKRVYAVYDVLLLISGDTKIVIPLWPNDQTRIRLLFILKSLIILFHEILWVSWT